MDTKFKNKNNNNNNNSNNKITDNIENLQKIDLPNSDSDAVNVPKKNKHILLLFVTILSFILTIFCFTAIKSNSNNYYNETDDNNIYSYMTEEAVRYVKNLNRFYIYFKNFDQSRTYDTIKLLEKFIAEKYNGMIPQSDIPNTNYDYNEDFPTDHVDEFNDYANDKTNNYDSEIQAIEKPYDYYTNIPDLETMDKKELITRYYELKKIYDNYWLVKNYLKNTKAFQYYIENTATNEIYKNNKNIENEGYCLKLSLDDNIFATTMFNGEYLSSSFEQNNLKGYIIIPNSLLNSPNSGTIFDEIKLSDKEEVLYKYFNYATWILSAIFLLSILLVVVKARSSAKKAIEKLYKPFAKIPLCLKIILFLVAIQFIFFTEIDIIYYICAKIGYMEILSYLIFLTISTFIFISFIRLAINILKSPSKLKQEFEIKFIVSLIHDCKYMLETKNYKILFLVLFFTIGTLLSLILFLFVLIMIYYIDFYRLMIIFLLEFTGLTIVYQTVKPLLIYCKLTYYIENITECKHEEITENSKTYGKAFDNLKTIENNVKKTIEEMTKNEKLKTELITSVSHDVRTPLTSIINYVDLLKKEELENDKAKEYINVLEQKSQRLKVLIEDLFEASKLSSGKMELETSKSDVIALLKQTIGELNNKIEESKINFMLELPKKQIYLNIDGQRIWRVFDNLLNNIIKYSPENSRAYISVEETETLVTITMKNISKAPLNFEPNELFERFKRGDSSRTTEGSGLGLSIAQNIVELHGGKMAISIDGDLFKISVILKK